MSERERDILVKFVDTYVSTFEAWDVLIYFAAHASESVSVVDLARDIGRRPEDLSQAAARLSSQGALERDRDGAWQLCADEDFRQGLDTFAKAIHDHKDRLYVLTRLLENLSR